MIKKDKYHNCFKPFIPNFQDKKKKKKHKNKNKSNHFESNLIVKTPQEKLNEVVEMLRFFGWDEKNIQSLADDWFELEDKK